MKLHLFNKMNFGERTSLQVFVSIFLLSAPRCCLWLRWPCAVVMSGFAETQALEGLEITHSDPARRPALPANPALRYTVRGAEQGSPPLCLSPASLSRSSCINVNALAHLVLVVASLNPATLCGVEPE